MDVRLTVPFHLKSPGALIVEDSFLEKRIVEDLNHFSVAADARNFERRPYILPWNKFLGRLVADRVKGFARLGDQFFDVGWDGRNFRKHSIALIQFAIAHLVASQRIRLALKPIRFRRGNVAFPLTGKSNQNASFCKLYEFDDLDRIHHEPDKMFL